MESFSTDTFSSLSNYFIPRSIFHPRKLVSSPDSQNSPSNSYNYYFSNSNSNLNSDWTDVSTGMSTVTTVATCMAVIGMICLITAVALYVWWRQRHEKASCLKHDAEGLAEKGQSPLAFLTHRMLSISSPPSPYSDKGNCGSCLPSNGVAALTVIPSIEYSELEMATKNFSNSNQLGIGGFGTVYRGRLSNNMEVAVKRLNKSSLDAIGPYQMEVELMSFLRSYHLVALLGRCEANNELLLVYELMEHGSLDTHLFGKSKGSMRLSWSMRMKIAIDAARGLEYLHSLDPPLVHRDFKSSNILLDKKLNAKVSDFGGVQRLTRTSSLGKDNGPMLGTFGYLAPEYVMTGMLTEKSDVYSFGVVLLELITGRRAVDTTLPTREQSLVTWASPFLAKKEEMLSIIDPVLKKEGINVKHLWQAAAISQLCCQPQPDFRPLMVDVVYSLRPLVLKKHGGDLLDQNKNLSIDQELRLEGPKSPPSAPSGELYELYDWRNSFKKSGPLTLPIDLEVEVRPE